MALWINGRQSRPISLDAHTMSRNNAVLLGNTHSTPSPVPLHQRPTEASTATAPSVPQTHSAAASAPHQPTGRSRGFGGSRPEPLIAPDAAADDGGVYVRRQGPARRREGCVVAPDSSTLAVRFPVGVVEAGRHPVGATGAKNNDKTYVMVFTN